MARKPVAPAPTPPANLLASPTFLTELAALIAKHNGTAAFVGNAEPVACSSMTLDDLLTRYLGERDVAKATAAFYRIKLKLFSKSLGRPATLADLADDTLNRFLAEVCEKRSRETARGARATLISLWNAAFESGLVQSPPRRVRKIKRNLPAPRAWSLDELRKLLDAAAKQRGRFRDRKLNRADYWRALILTAYDTGLRLGDLMKLRLSDMTPDAPFPVVQSKTGKPVMVRIRPETWKAIHKTLPYQRRRLFDVISRRSFLIAFKRLVKDAGLVGTFKYLRRSSGSHVEAVEPGAGGKHLGHADPLIFDKHYHDRRLTDRAPVLPPAIGNWQDQSDS